MSKKCQLDKYNKRFKCFLQQFTSPDNNNEEVSNKVSNEVIEYIISECEKSMSKLTDCLTYSNVSTYLKNRTSFGQEYSLGDRTSFGREYSLGDRTSFGREYNDPLYINEIIERCGGYIFYFTKEELAVIEGVYSILNELSDVMLDDGYMLYKICDSHNITLPKRITDKIVTKNMRKLIFNEGVCKKIFQELGIKFNPIKV